MINFKATTHKEKLVEQTWLLGSSEIKKKKWRTADLSASADAKPAALKTALIMNLMCVHWKISYKRNISPNPIILNIYLHILGGANHLLFKHKIICSNIAKVLNKSM